VNRRDKVMQKPDGGDHRSELFNVDNVILETLFNVDIINVESRPSKTLYIIQGLSPKHDGGDRRSKDISFDNVQTDNPTGNTHSLIVDIVNNSESRPQERRFQD
jgi:hypothetical protein